MWVKVLKSVLTLKCIGWLLCIALTVLYCNAADCVHTINGVIDAFELCKTARASIFATSDGPFLSRPRNVTPIRSMDIHYGNAISWYKQVHIVHDR